MDKIKILRIFSRLNIGGPAIHTILLTANLNSDRFESILVKGSEDPFEGNMMYLAREKGVEPIVIPEMGRDISLLDDLKTFFCIYRLIKNERPHIIHTHTAKAGGLGRGAAVLVKGEELVVRTLRRLLFFNNSQPPTKNSQPKIVHTFHGHVFNGYFGPAKTNLFLWIERLSGFFTDKIITVSERQREEIMGFKIGSQKKVVSVSLGLELERFLDTERHRGYLRRELGFSAKTKLVGIIARLVPIKNHKMFIDAATELKVKSEKLEVKFLIVGDGELRGNLEDYVRKKGLEDDIVFLGFRRDMERVYADLDLVVLTSINEGSPVALIEAMSAGRPVVSTDVGGVGDLLSSRFKVQGSRFNLRYCKEGILVDSGDSEGLAMAMKELLEDDMLMQRMGEKGKEAVYPRYDISCLVKNMEELYKGMVKIGI